MAVTRRRLDFLRTVKQIYESTNLPVHYVRVAQALGISKWSAYEMLKTLEKEGLVASQYEVNQAEKHPGRAMVLFSPTQMLDKVLSARAFEAPVREWRHIKEKLLSMCEEVKEKKAAKVAKQLMGELTATESPMIFSAYVITILVAQVQTMSDRSVDLIKKMVAEAANPESGLAMFSAAVIASLHKIDSRFVSAIGGHFSKFQKNLAMLNKKEQIQLMDFLSDALSRAS